MSGVKLCAYINITDSLQRSCFLSHVLIFISAEMSSAHKVVVSNFFFSFYICAFYSDGHPQNTQTQQWAVWCLLSQSMWTLQKQTWLLFALTHWDILGWSFPALWRPGIWLKTTQRPAIVCCSSFQSAAKIISLCWLYWWCNWHDPSSKTSRFCELCRRFDSFACFQTSSH